jgi:hypothetical protein
VIPDTTEITVQDGTLQWENNDFMISLDEAEAIAEELQNHLRRNSIDTVLVDNRGADGTWPQEVTELWAELMGEMYQEGIDCATVSPSATNAMQINQLSEQNGTDERIRAFTDLNEANEFLGK